MRRTAAIALILIGVAIAVLGQRRAESVSGLSNRAGTKIANAWDGGLRVPEHYWFYAGGGVLAAFGLFLAVRRP